MTTMSTGFWVITEFFPPEALSATFSGHPDGGIAVRK
jgi:hypothetical protein